jgi:LytS/YehU family sensor histidine kinase
MQPAKFSGRHLWVRLPRILALAALGALLGFAVGHALRHGRLDPALLWERFIGALGVIAPAVVLASFGLLGLIWAVAQIRRQMLERELAQTRLQGERDAAARQAAEARLKLLQAQIQPHFVFNTLSAVQHWVDIGDKRGADLLRSLTGFLRGSTDAIGRDELRLDEEASLIGHYLAIMQARLGERLRHSIDIAPQVAGQRLPAGLLLTLVENAVEHGIAGSLAGGEVGVRAWAEGGCCEIRVTDSAAALPAAWREGVGLANCRERLLHRFGERASLRLQLRADCTEAALRVPLQLTSSTEQETGETT